MKHEMLEVGVGSGETKQIVTVELPVPETTEEAIAFYGDAIVLGLFAKQLKINRAGEIRLAAFDCEKTESGNVFTRTAATQEELQALAEKIPTLERTRKAKTPKTPEQAAREALELFKALPPELQAMLRGQIG